MCLYPKLVKNPKYRPNKKNKGIVPVVPDSRVLWVPIGCGKCLECRKQKARNWSVRLQEEIRHDRHAMFVTLTFSTANIKRLTKDIDLEGYARDNEMVRIALRRFFDRWRKKNKGRTVKHWLITELGHGDTEHIHVHGIIWSKDREMLVETWNYGFVYMGYSMNEMCVNYIMKYITKVDPQHKYYTPKVFTSPAIGKGYFKRSDWHKNKFDPRTGMTDERYKFRNGSICTLPIYYRNKIYDDDEREMLWLEKLDKEERYVLGVRVDVSKGYDDYYQLLEDAQKKSKRLGYEDDTINWDLKKYEDDRRNAIYKNRIAAV